MTTALTIMGSLSGLGTLFILAAVIASRRPLPQYESELIGPRNNQDLVPDNEPGFPAVEGAAAIRNWLPLGSH